MRDRGDHARGWLRKADADLLTATRLLEAGGPFDAVCFHAQQAGEKYLKAVLAWTRQPIPRTHNLEDLLPLCVAVEPRWKRLAVDVTVLTPYAVELRYDFEFWPDAETAGEALNIATAVRDLLLGMLPEDLA